MDITFLKDNKVLIVGGIASVAVLWYVAKNFSGGSRTITRTITRAAQSGTNGRQQAATIVAEGQSQSNIINAQSAFLRANNEPILAEYLAGTNIADTALRAAGNSQIAGMQAASSAMSSYNHALEKIAGASASSIQKVAEANARSQPSFSLGYGPYKIGGKM